MKQIKFLVFGLRNLLIKAGADSSTGKGDFDSPLTHEFGRLIAYARAQGIEPVVFANHGWTMHGGEQVEDLLARKWGAMRWITADGRRFPFKPQAGAMDAVLKELKCDPNEVLYIGNSEDDMRTAVNGEVLFLNAVWLTDSTGYGFRFDSPKDIAKFIDVFCVRSAGWAFEIDDGPLRYRSLAPFSTMYSQYGAYSANARSTKDGWGEPAFWGPYLCATLFLTGLYREFDYVCPFPRHTAHEWNEPLRESIVNFAKCFRKRYIPDLVVRHTSTVSSRRNPETLGHLDHLNSIRINDRPTKNVDTEATYVRSPLGRGKTVMVVDDFCTRGRSIEAARVYLERTGVNVILVSWLKTINRDYSAIVGDFDFNPYVANEWSKVKLGTKIYPYRVAMTDDDAYKELTTKFERFKRWEWPTGL